MDAFFKDVCQIQRGTYLKLQPTVTWRAFSSGVIRSSPLLVEAPTVKMWVDARMKSQQQELAPWN
jgi:hypothetical protein